MNARCVSVLLAAAAASAPAAEPVRYIDAHSHLVGSMPVADEIARLRSTGLERVVIMDPDPDQLRTLVDRYAGFVIPFISVARTAQMPGTRLDAATAATMARLQAAGAVCGFGEVPTRLDPNPEPSDAAAIDNAYRRAIYAVANERGVPVNVHLAIESAQTAAAVARIASAYPKMSLILAHAGWSAGPEVLAPLLAAHPNLYADLSVRLDRPGAPGVDPRLAISIVDAGGMLKPAWRALIERFPGRFLFGLDVTMTERPQHVAELFAQARATLGRLPRKTEEAIAHGNIDRLLRGCRLAQIPENPVSYTGVLVSAAADGVVLRQHDGAFVAIAMTRNWTISTPRPGSAAAIKAGDFIASIQSDIDPSSGTARELRVFEPGYEPEIGTHAMPQPGVSITHGTVARVTQLAGGARELQVRYPGGQRRIVVPADVKVTLSELRDPASARPGTTVSAVTRRRGDGAPLAGRLVLPPS